MIIIIIAIFIIRSDFGSRLRKDTYSWKCLATMAAEDAAAETTASSLAPAMAAEDAAAETTMSPLAHLTSQSGAFGRWEVLIFAPEAQEREYIFEGKKTEP